MKGNKNVPAKQKSRGNVSFLTFPACFKIPIFFSNLNYNCSNLLDMRNLQEQVKKHSVAKNCSDLSQFE